MSRDHKGAPGEATGPSGPVDSVDAVLALVLILACGVLFYVTTGFEEPAMFLGENVLPAEFPQMLLLTIGVLSLALPFEHLLERRRHPLIRKARSAPVGLITWATIGLLIVILALAETLGTVLTMLVASLALPLLWGERRWWLLLVYAAGFTGAVTYVFAVVLGVYFEPGVFGISVR